MRPASQAAFLQAVRPADPVRHGAALQTASPGQPWLGALCCLLIWSLAWLSGCSSRPAARDTSWRLEVHRPESLQLPPLTEAPCPGGGERPRSRTAFTIAVPGQVVPGHAPLPRSEAERHLFGNIYETLTRIDCHGQVEPGLATSWQAYDDGRTWVFQLRPDARFWDGTPLGAVHVIEAWRRAEDLSRQLAEPSPFLRFDPRGSSLEVLGARELALHLHAASDHLPLLLAHPALAVTGPAGPDGWLVGSGPLRPQETGDQTRLDLVPVPGHPRAPAWERLHLRFGDLEDPQGLFGPGADALLTRRDEDVRHFSLRRDARLDPLPWDLTYYLITPTEETGADDEDRRRWTSGWDQIELAREVAGQTAGPAEFFALEPLLAPCPVLPPAVPVLPWPSLAGRTITASRDVDLVVWPANDPGAGRLAQHLADLAARPLRPGPERPGRGPLTPPAPLQAGVAPEAIEVPADELAAHIQAARVGAVVLPWPHRWALPCDELASLLSLADWLVEAGLTQGPDVRTVPPGARAARPSEDFEPPQALAIARRLERSKAVQPLLRSRAFLVRSPGLAGFSCDHDGTLRLWSGGWSEDPAPTP